MYLLTCLELKPKQNKKDAETFSETKKNKNIIKWHNEEDDWLLLWWRKGRERKQL